MLHLKVQFIYLLASTVIAVLANDASHWGYPDRDAKEEFPHWSGICGEGRHQSPIDLRLKGALKGVFPKLDFQHYDDEQEGVKFINNGHTVQLYDFPHKMQLRGGPLLGTYIMEQAHFHWWSEHTIDYIRYPLEAHIVHRNKIYPNMTEAAKHKDGIAVVGILYHVAKEHNKAIDQMLENIDDVKSYDKVDKPVTLKKKFVVRQLFPQIHGYLTYAGSLTTPPCAESVTWIVMHQSFPVTLDQIETLKGIEYEKDKHLTSNYRPVQDTNNRPIVAVLSVDSLDKANTAAAAVSSGLLFLLCVLLPRTLH